MTQKGWGVSGDPLPKLGVIPEDPSWTKYLPKGSSVTSAVGYGASYWSQSGKIDIKLANGGAQALFIKFTSKSMGAEKMCEGEFESMKMLSSISPELFPAPIAHGILESDPEMHFFLSEFVELEEGLPDKVRFCKAVAQYHRKSQKFSQNGMFGFHVPTCNGTMPHYVAWNTSWETFYTEMIKHGLQREEEIQGPWPELAPLLPAFFDKVIPRLLRPLETEGRILRPTLVHGDLWDGNVKMNTKTGQPSMFDAASFWAHNEIEMKGWRSARFHINREFVHEYFNHNPPSAPEEDWSDRNLLYSIRVDIYDSIMWPSTTRFRQLSVESIKQLVERYPSGYEGDCDRKDVIAAKDAR